MESESGNGVDSARLSVDSVYTMTIICVQAVHFL